jgi:acyl-CoA synthetase (AMP-forming)/AMP-acid ligase II
MTDVSLAGLLEQPPDDADRAALWDRDGATSWGELAGEFARQRRQLTGLSRRRVGLALRADQTGVAMLAALESLASDLFLFDADLPMAPREAWSEQLGLDATLPADRPTGSESDLAAAPGESGGARRGEPPDAGHEGSVTILTSGSTGQPKAVRHSWHRLARPVRRQTSSSSSPPTWLLAYRPHLYAGLQVILQALLNRGTLVVPGPLAEPGEVLSLMATAGVTHASATPSYWRRLLTWSDEATQRRVPLTQITLGGEVVDQTILDQLQATFPAARRVHIYATTELGRCFSVTDGRAGFPQSWLDTTSSDGVELQVRDGQLWVRSANAMSGYDGRDGQAATVDADGWFATGDLVERRGDRVYFVGRNSDMINVGGNKVYPVAVERVIRQLVEVAEVRVFGQSSSLAGELVACQVVPATGQSGDVVRQRVREHCQMQLDRYQCPRWIEIVDRLPLSDAGKLVR